MDFFEYRHMIFVDGENFTIRGREFAKAAGLKLIEGSSWVPDTFLWFPGMHGEYPEFSRQAWMARHMQRVDIQAQKAFYYTAVAGDERKLRKTRLAIRALGFEPNVFKKLKGTRSKGVDVSLTTDIVSLAYRDRYDVAYLLAGDGDYEPMINEVKRAGKRVAVAFFEKQGLNPELRIAADRFIDVSKQFELYWKQEHSRLEQEKNDLGNS
jgi:uncharacterized LabA/DUF88 family protein